MILRIAPGAVALASVFMIAGCGGPSGNAAPEASPANTTTVVREEVKSPEPQAPAPLPAQAIQTQPGPKGSQVALQRVAVTGDVLTVQLAYSGGTGYSHPKLDEISIIDDATAKQLGVLKDNAGSWLAAPKGAGGNDLSVSLQNTPTIIWFKTPAPPATSKTVSINVPEVGPFDGVPVTR